MWWLARTAARDPPQSQDSSDILVTGQGEVRLLDFGMARLLQPETDAALLTRVYGLALTPEYRELPMFAAKPSTRAAIYARRRPARTADGRASRPAHTTAERQHPNACTMHCATSWGWRCSQIQPTGIRTQ